MTLAGIAYEALDNGFLSCAEPAQLQAICADLSAERIERFSRKWLGCLPQPFTPADQAAGYPCELSMLQVECSLTHVLDRPLTGRVFFEEVTKTSTSDGPTRCVDLCAACDQAHARSLPHPG
jgi:hypothetical protein